MLETNIVTHYIYLLTLESSYSADGRLHQSQNDQIFEEAVLSHTPNK